MFESRRRYRSSKHEEYRRKIRTVVLAVSLTLMGLLVVGLSWLSSRPFLHIDEIKVEGNSVVKTEDVVKVAKERLKGSYLGLFSKSNSLIYPREEVQKSVEEAFDRFETVDIYTDYMNTIVLSVKERAPVALWCGTRMKEYEADEACYFLDKRGYIFDEAPDFSGSVFVKIYSPEISATDPIGVSFLDIKTFENLMSFLSMLDEKGIEPETLIYEDGESVEVTVRSSSLKVLDESKIIFKLKDNTDNVFSNLETVLLSDEFGGGNKTAQAEDTRRIEYLDLRFGNRVYYRFKGTGVTSSEQPLPSPVSSSLGADVALPPETQ